MLDWKRTRDWARAASDRGVRAEARLRGEASVVLGSVQSGSSRGFRIRRRRGRRARTTSEVPLLILLDVRVPQLVCLLDAVLRDVLGEAVARDALQALDVAARVARQRILTAQHLLQQLPRELREAERLASHFVLRVHPEHERRTTGARQRQVSSVSERINFERVQLSVTATCAAPVCLQLTDHPTMESAQPHTASAPTLNVMASAVSHNGQLLLLAAARS